MRKAIKSFLFLYVLAVSIALAAVATAQAPDTASEAAEGLWAYTGLTPRGQEEFSLTGMFVFKDGKFIQQSINDGEPFEAQGAMAHAGTYRHTPDGIQMVAEQTISVSPENTPPFSERGKTEHELAVARSGDELTLTFGSGTVQTFKRLGDGVGEIYALEDGMLAFVDGRFLLVAAQDDGVVTGCGAFERQGESYTLEVSRWAEAKGSKVSYRRDEKVKATFDGKRLTLSDGASFQVK
jgi:hypothetical protein